MDFLLTILIEINDWFSLIVVVRVTGRGPYLESHGNFSGPGQLFFVCRVCIQDQSFNNFENGTMKLSLNEAKTDWFLSWELWYYSTGFNFKIRLRARKDIGPFEKCAPSEKAKAKPSFHWCQENPLKSGNLLFPDPNVPDFPEKRKFVVCHRLGYRG